MWGDMLHGCCLSMGSQVSLFFLSLISFEVLTGFVSVAKSTVAFLHAIDSRLLLPRCSLSTGLVFFGLGATVRYLRAADALGSSWPTLSTQIDGPNSSIGSYPTMFLSAAIINSNPAVTYYASYSLKYVRASDVNGTV